jgi:DNA-binding transcriptional LysR family regulator
MNTHRWPQLDLRHLAAFDTVAETGSFAEAGRRLGYTQSAVSQQIAALERTRGARLLERPGGRRRVTPTEAGQLLLRHTRRIAGSLQAAEADLAALAEGCARVVRVGAFPSVTVRILPDVLRRFFAAQPGVDVRLIEAPYERDLMEPAERGELDLTFMVLPVQVPSLEAIELLRDPYVLLVPAESDLAGRRTALSLRELRTMPLVGHSRGSGGVEAVMRSRGIEPNVVFRSDESGAVQRLVAAGVGLALVPRLTVEPSDPDVVVLDASRELPPRVIGIAWHRDRTLSEAATVFVGVLREVCAGLAR